MNPRALCALILAFMACLAPAIADPPAGSTATGLQALTTQFTYTATATAPARAKALDMWLPIPSDSAWQKVTDLTVDSPAPYRVTTETKYGDRMVYVHADNPTTPLVVSVHFTVSRQAVRVLDSHGPAPEDETLTPILAADSRVPIGGEFLSIADQATHGDKTDLQKERSLFNDVVATMRYDYRYQSPEYAQGDSAFVCNYKSGNCSDLHSYLISLSRSAGIPAVLEFGFPLTGIPAASPLPADGAITGYHCWVWVHDPRLGWVPMDAADARRWEDAGQPRVARYLFGNLVLARGAVAMSRGRDIVLAPAQHGPPLNYFIYPYAEADGKPVSAGWTLGYHIVSSR